MFSVWEHFLIQKQKKRKCNYLKFNNLQILFSLKSGVGGYQIISYYEHVMFKFKRCYHCCYHE